ncbi:MAG: hypothetical protein KAH06_05120 [Desulfobacterales bacterium]|nr:hypothetical protein [Desulfobacterales bacterium]
MMTGRNIGCPRDIVSNWQTVYGNVSTDQYTGHDDQYDNLPRSTKADFSGIFYPANPVVAGGLQNEIIIMQWSFST